MRSCQRWRLARPPKLQPPQVDWGRSEDQREEDNQVSRPPGTVRGRRRTRTLLEFEEREKAPAWMKWHDHLAPTGGAAAPSAPPSAGGAAARHRRPSEGDAFCSAHKVVGAPPPSLSGAHDHHLHPLETVGLGRGLMTSSGGDEESRVIDQEI